MNVNRLFKIKATGIKLDGELTEAPSGYEYLQDGIFLTVEEKAEDGIRIRRSVIKNTGDKPVKLRELLSKFVFDGGEYEVYTQYSHWTAESKGKWQPLSTGIFAKSKEIRTNNSSNPFFAIYNTQNQRGWAFHIISDGLWQYRIYRNFIQARYNMEVMVEAGYEDLDYELMPQEALELPTVLYYQFKNKLDLDAYKLHAYVNRKQTPRLPVIYNSWMGVFDNISTDILMPQLERAREIGCEYFVIDAGWFGEKYKWFHNVGDWREITTSQMMGKMKEFADTVRSYGLKFGLWFEIERASLTSQAVKEHPEYYIFEGDHAFVDFAKKEAVDHIFDVLAGNIRKYNIEFIKFDFNAMLSYDERDRAFIDYFKGYKAFMARIRAEFPDIYLECCASGGLRMSLNNLQSFDSFWISDNHSINAQLEIYKDTLIRMPSNILEKWITVGSTSNGKPAITVSGDAGWGFVEGVKPEFLEAIMLSGPIGISCDLTKLLPEHLEILKGQIQKHKAERDFWQRSQARILANTETLTCIQYSDEKSERIKLFTFSKRRMQNKYTAYPLCEGNYISGDTVYNEPSENGIEIIIQGDFMGNILELSKIKE